MYIIYTFIFNFYYIDSYMHLDIWYINKIITYPLPQ